jgi:hypothetical protein
MADQAAEREDLASRILATLGGATFGPGELRAALVEALNIDPEFVRVHVNVPAEDTLHGRDAMLRIEILRPYPLSG